MNQLYVSVRLNDTVADQRLCTVSDEVWLGEMQGALVAFPGPSVRVRRIGGRLQVQGRWLDVGRVMRMRRGDLEVTLEAVPSKRGWRPISWPLPDLRVLVASAAIVLLGAWWETVGAFLERHPAAIASLSGASEHTNVSEAVLKPSLGGASSVGASGVSDPSNTPHSLNSDPPGRRIPIERVVLPVQYRETCDALPEGPTAAE